MTLNHATAVLVLTIGASALAGGLEIVRHTIDGGGGTSRGAEFTVSGTIGQPDTGTQAGAGFQISGGFWYSGSPTSSSCPADTDGDGLVDFNDLLAVLAGWGPCGSICSGDVTDDGTVDFDDLLVVLAGWGTCPE